MIIESGKQTFDNFKGLIDDRPIGPSAHRTSEKDSLNAIKRLKKKAIDQGDTNSIFYKLSIEELLQKKKENIKKAKRKASKALCKIFGDKLYHMTKGELNGKLEQLLEKAKRGNEYNSPFYRLSVEDALDAVEEIRKRTKKDDE